MHLPPRQSIAIHLIPQHTHRSPSLTALIALKQTNTPSPPTTHDIVRAGMQTKRQTNRQKDRQTDRQTNRQKDRQTDRQTNRQTDRHTCHTQTSKPVFQLDR